MSSRPLRIALCCQQDLGNRHAVPAYRFWAEYFRSALAELGHICLEIPACDWAAGLLARPSSEQAAWREKTWSHALHWLSAEHARQPIDLFLAYLFPAQIEPVALGQLRGLGVPSVNFFCDNLRLFRTVPASFRGFDLHWVPEAVARSLYRDAGLPYLSAPMPCWIAPQWRTLPPRETLPATFVGTRDSVREDLFASAFARGLDADLRGHGWSAETVPSAPLPSPAPGGSLFRHQIDFLRDHGAVAFARKFHEKISPPPPCTFNFRPHVRPMPADDDYFHVLRDSLVSLGVNRYPSLRSPRTRSPTYSRLRDLEAPMCGACYLTEWAPGLDELYDLGTEIETYRTAEELVEKTRLLATDATRRASLRRAGQRRALADHTIARTLARLTAHLGLGKR
jgi:hypothetical protein